MVKTVASHTHATKRNKLKLVNNTLIAVNSNTFAKNTQAQ